MRRFKREEPFRYEFIQPQDTSFYISRFRGKTSQSSRGKGVVRNISPGGLRLETDFNLPKGDEIEITIELDIANHIIEPVGFIVWKDQSHDRFLYGIRFTSNDFAQDIIRALKDFRSTIK